MSLVDYENYECAGCGRTSKEIAEYQDWDDSDFESCSITTDSGNWYCHTDCLRDSR